MKRAAVTVNNVLIVDDEPNVAAALKRVLNDEPYLIYTAGSAEEGMLLLRTYPVTVVISDEEMPGIHGSEFLSLVHREFPDVIRIILTGHASVDAAIRAINEGEIYRFFTKPWNDPEIRFAIRAAVEKYDLEEENRNLLKIMFALQIFPAPFAHRWRILNILFGIYMRERSARQGYCFQVGPP